MCKTVFHCLMLHRVQTLCNYRWGGKPSINTSGQTEEKFDRCSGIFRSHYENRIKTPKTKTVGNIQGTVCKNVVTAINMQLPTSYTSGKEQPVLGMFSTTTGLTDILTD